MRLTPTTTTAVQSKARGAAATAGDKRSALDAPDTDDDDGCAE
jgi:hypothetical protein